MLLTVLLTMIHPTADYGAAANFPSKKLIISQQRLKSKNLSLWIKNSLTTDEKHKLRAFKTSYTYNNQDDGATIFFVIVKFYRPDTCAGYLYIKTNI